MIILSPNPSLTQTRKQKECEEEEAEEEHHRNASLPLVVRVQKQPLQSYKIIIKKVKKIKINKIIITLLQ